MKSDSVAMGLLFDRYGELLTEKQRACFDLYHNQDFSLAEIAEEAGVSRQSVHDAVLRAEAALREYEAKLGCAAHAARVRQALAVITAAAAAIESGDANAKALAGDILRAAGSIKE